MFFFFFKPETIKQHAIIEKTARFIAEQGIQMEILLKAKQSNNVQFEFLSQNGVLNPYYKHILEAIKNGKYPERIIIQNIEEEEAKQQQENNNDNEELNKKTEEGEGEEEEDLEASPIVIPIIKYKPSADCAYTQLISKIKGVPVNELEKLQCFGNYYKDFLLLIRIMKIMKEN